MSRIPLLALVVLATGALRAGGTDEGPVQPIPFSHKQHAGELEIECSHCHTNPDPGEMMTFPATKICMECHAAIDADSPQIRKLAQAAADGQPIAWKRVYEIPGYVYFSHRSHVAAGAHCERCHGQVAERARLFREGDVSMGACVNCHLEKGASLDCAYCHEPLE